VERLEVQAGDYVFQARAAGPPDGRLVLLLHGFPQSSFEWRHQLQALGDAGYRAVAPDQRGYSPGARPHGIEQYRVQHLVADVLAIADVQGALRFDLVGHDWGAAVAWQLAGRHPERLRSLTIVSVPHPAAFEGALRGESDQAQRSSYVDFFRQEGSEETFVADGGAGLRNLFAVTGLADCDEYVDLLLQPGAMKAALNWYRAMSIGAFEGMGPVTTPTLYVWSDQDQALGREAAEATAGHVRGPYRFEVLEGIGHWIPEHAPERLSDLLLEHLRATG